MVAYTRKSPAWQTGDVVGASDAERWEQLGADVASARWGGYTYLIGVSGSPGSATYTAWDRGGVVVSQVADTGTTSGLKSVLEGLAGDGVVFQFTPGRFHFLDAPVGNESWASVQDHGSFGTAATPTRGLTFRGAGMYATTISARSNWSGAADVEPLSFTNCQGVTITDLTVEGCGAYKSSTDAIDLDQGARARIERVRVTRARGRGIVIDGGDDGRNGQNTTIRDCLIEGRPPMPMLSLVSGGSLTVSTAYRYAVSYTDADLAGAQTAGETMVSDVAQITTTSGNLSIRVQLPIGPYTTTERKVYRAPAGSASWVRVATIADNTTTTYTDTGGAGTGVTMPVSSSSNIPASGIELLGTSRCRVADNTVDGCGGSNSGATMGGVNVVRKGSGSSTKNSDRNRVTGNSIRATTGPCIRILGGSDNIVTGNELTNPGTVATKSQAFRIDGATGSTQNRNMFLGNRCFDDRDANSPSTGQGMNNVVSITATATPTNNVIGENVLTQGASATHVSDSGTTTTDRGNLKL